MRASDPNPIYKYESFSVQTLRNLKSQSIYFGSPKNFNDPYDCALRVNISEPDDSQVNTIRNHYLSATDLQEAARCELEEMPLEELRAVVLRSVRHVAETSINTFLAERGVTCFSEINDDLLMWSHYDGKGGGFCLEFSTEFEPLHNLRKIRYVEEMPKLDPVMAIVEDCYEEYLDLFCTKSKNWSYEREWRAMHQKAGTVFTYPAEALRGVYFGPDIDQQSLEIICLILLGQNPHVGFWKGKRSTERFKVEFEHFTYTNYLEAKAKGLVV